MTNYEGEEIILTKENIFVEIKMLFVQDNSTLLAREELRSSLIKKGKKNHYITLVEKMRQYTNFEGTFAKILNVLAPCSATAELFKILTN